MFRVIISCTVLKHACHAFRTKAAMRCQNATLVNPPETPQIHLVFDLGDCVFKKPWLLSSPLQLPYSVMSYEVTSYSKTLRAELSWSNISRTHILVLLFSCSCKVSCRSAQSSRKHQWGLREAAHQSSLPVTPELLVRPEEAARLSSPLTMVLAAGTNTH